MSEFPTRPTYAAAQNAYQVLMELLRAHPDDGDLKAAFTCAEALVVELWLAEVKRC